MKIAIVGAGKLGLKVAASLISPTNYITIIDINPVIIQKANNEMDVMAVTGNGLRFDVLNEIKISDHDFLLALTDDDEKNLVISSIAKKLGCKHTIARLRDPEYSKQLDFVKQTFNVDFIVNPDKLISYEIFSYLLNKHENLNQFFTGATIGMLEIKADSIKGLVGDKVLNAPKYLENLLIVSVSRKGKIIIPKSHVTIESGDLLYLLGKKPDIAKLSASIHTSEEGASVHKVMIMGGGKTGFYLGQSLSEAGISVKIIEKNRERCEYLSEKLEDVLILHGDATDVSLLQEENISSMDAFITATGYDEDNLLLALIAQQYGVREVIAKTSRGNYSTLTDKIGVYTTLNTLEITTSHILRLVQKGNFVASSFFLQGQAEIFEVVINKDMLIEGKKLKDLKLPDGVLVSLIYRDTEAIVPVGNTDIKAKDRLIFFSMLSDVPELERILQSTKRKIFRI
ncbi:MAG: Trk system potassium transporter TrkA [Firmicutes bacterium]|nr:Trk system potassium transporter TrkA [Clostridiales bacterium]MBQ4340063.1 Trk system potassium transporter TrkA [Bacillota bacterium]